MESRDSISKYGHSFQTKLIGSVLTDVVFISQVYDILKEEYFESASIKWIVKKCFTYYNEYKKIPTIDVLKVYTDRVDDELLRQEIISTLRESIKQIDASDLEFVKNETVSFCKNQELKSAILQSVEYLKLEKYDAIKEIIDRALKVGMSNNIGLDYLEDIEPRYTTDARSPIPTGWPVLDTLLKGGLSAGELGVFVASSGGGKSWILTNIGAHAIKHNYTVFHYSLELNESYSGLRYDAVISGISLDKLPIHKDRLPEILKDVPGKLYIKWYPMRSISLMGLRAHIEKSKLIGIVPDLIVIDYADLLKYTGTSDKEEHILKSLYEDLKGFAGELQVPVWTVSQANREGLDADVLEANKISSAYSKIFPADFVASLSRKRQDKLANTARMHVIKNRFGADGMTFPVMMDTNRGAIEIYDEVSEDGKKTSAKMQSDNEFNKSNAKKRYAELFSKQDKKPGW